MKHVNGWKLWYRFFFSLMIAWWCSVFHLFFFGQFASILNGSLTTFIFLILLVNKFPVIEEIELDEKEEADAPKSALPHLIEEYATPGWAIFVWFVWLGVFVIELNWGKLL